MVDGEEAQSDESAAPICLRDGRGRVLRHRLSSACASWPVPPLLASAVISI